MQNNQIPFSNFPQNFNRTMQIVEPTYEQHIIKAPELNVTNGRIPQVLVLDSSDRNCKKYPKPNNYAYELTKEYKDVISIELVQGCIPYTGYAINENNNKLFVQETSGETVEVVVPPGNYNATELAIALETALNNNTDLSSTYTVSADTNTQKFTIGRDVTSGTGIFNILNNCCPCSKNSFTDMDNTDCNDCDSCQMCSRNNCNDYIKGSISKKLGFSNVNYMDANTYTSDFVWDLEDPKYIILEIENLENIDSNNKNIDDSFAVIFFTVPHCDNNILATGSTPRKGIKKYFNPPLSTLDKLRIKFLTPDGELYDFNGRNHVLEFNILALNQPGKYNTFITT